MEELDAKVGVREPQALESFVNPATEVNVILCF